MHEFLANVGLASTSKLVSQIAVNESLNGIDGYQALVSAGFAPPQWGFAKFMNAIRASEKTAAGFLGGLDFSASTFSCSVFGSESK